MKVTIVDNFDSFSYNIKQSLTYAGCTDVEVVRYDILKNIASSNVIISPGPGLPKDYPKLKNILNNNNVVLGICLGHQAIGEYFGGTLSKLNKPIHGEGSEITITDKNCKIFSDIERLIGGRYHSWHVSETALTITARCGDGIIMGIRNDDQSIQGVQFHPESILTEEGIGIITNWLNNCCLKD